MAETSPSRQARTTSTVVDRPLMVIRSLFGARGFEMNSGIECLRHLIEWSISDAGVSAALELARAARA